MDDAKINQPEVIEHVKAPVGRPSRFNDAIKEKIIEYKNTPKTLERRIQKWFIIKQVM